MGVVPPTAKQLTADDYHRLLKRIAPRGKLWRAFLGTRLDKWFEAAAEELARVHGLVYDLLVEESKPSTSEHIIDGWIEAVGIPDDCTTTVPSTLAEKQALALARWLATGGSDAAFFIARALDLGFTITITESLYDPFRCGTGRCGDAMNDEVSAFYWQVNASASLTTAQRALLECEINRLKPAHTIALYVYS